jgi:hypothetical protein
MFQVTQIGRFLLERGLRFRKFGFCGHDPTWTATFKLQQHRPMRMCRSTRRARDSPFSRAAPGARKGGLGPPALGPVRFRRSRLPISTEAAGSESATGLTRKSARVGNGATQEPLSGTST